MNTEILSDSLPVNLPNGQYTGIWTGYRVKIKIAGMGCVLETKDGIRGINEPCIVTVKDGQATVKTR